MMIRKINQDRAQSRDSAPDTEAGLRGVSPKSEATNDGFQARLELARQFGNSTIAYSTVCQPGLRYHYSRDGFQAFGSKWGYDFALGDPIVSPSEVDGLVGDFIQRCKRKPCFVNITERTARALANRGYYVNCMGVDTWLELDEYDFRGKSKEALRYAANWLSRRGFRVVEADFHEIDRKLPEEVSRKWRETRTVKDREVAFLNRPLVLDHEPDVRRFFLFDEQDKLQAFVFLDPVYQDGDVVGYSTVFKRRDPESPAYAEQGIMKHCVDKLKQEGIKSLRLGLSPLANLSDRTFRKRNHLIHFGWSYGFKAWWVNRYFYNLQGHAAFKRRFRGNEYPVYFATPALVSDLRIAAMLRLMGVLGGKKIMPADDLDGLG